MPTQPISPLSTTTNLSYSSSIASRSSVLAKAKRKENSRVTTRLINSQDTMSPRPISASLRPSGDPLPTTAQQLYASSLGLKPTTSPPSSRRPSVSSIRTSSNSDPDETSPPGACSSTSQSPPKTSAFKRLPPGHRTKKNSSATSSPSLSPPSVNILLDSHDPRNFFDCTRLSGGPRRFIHEGLPQGVSAAASSAHPSAQSPYKRHSVPSRAVSSGNDGSSNVNLLLSLGKLAVSSDSTSTVALAGQISKEAQALYHPAIFLKPVTASSISASKHRNHGSICFPISSSPSTQDEQKPVQPISSVDKRSSDTLRLYSAITEDEKLRAIPNPSSGSLLPIQITEDQTTNQGSKRRESQFPPTINVLDVQNSSSPSCIQIQTKLDRRNTVSYSPADKRRCRDPSLAESLVLQQPRPIRPLIAIPARFNLQLEGAEQGAFLKELSAEDQVKDKGTTRRSSVFRRLSGVARTREPQKSILDPS